MKKNSVWKMTLTAAVMIFGVESAVAETVLKLGTTGRLGMPIGDAIDQALIPAMQKASGGQMKIEPHYQRSLCAEQKCGEQANQGLLALWTSSTANFGSFGTELAIFDLPFIFKSLEDAKRISNSWLAERQCKLALENAGHICLSVYSSGGFRQLGNATKSVRVPADMKGLKWRVTKSPIEYMLVKNWGAVPVPYDWSQLYQGLQSGVVEGQYVASPWQHVAKLHEVAKYYTEIGGMWSGNILAIDAAQYNALSAQEKKWLHEAADARRGRSIDISPKCRRFRRSIESRENLCCKGSCVFARIDGGSEHDLRVWKLGQVLVHTNGLGAIGNAAER